MREKDRTEEVRRLAGEIYEERYAYLLRIAKRNAATAADADYDPALGAPPLAWRTLVMKRRCWRLRDAAHLDRRIGADPEGEHEQPTALIRRLPSTSPPLAERVAECEEARQHISALKPDERTAIGMVAAGFTYEEIGRTQCWTHTKLNRCLYEGRRALRREVAC